MKIQLIHLVFVLKILDGANVLFLRFCYIAMHLIPKLELERKSDNYVIGYENHKVIASLNWSN